MEYTVQRLAKLAGISARTLRHYDQIGLLRPARVSSNGYRIYGAREVALLQQILFYRAVDMPLEEIRAAVQSPGFDALAALRAHQRGLGERRARLERVMQTVERTIAALEGGFTMQDEERFEGLKEQMLAENEAQYGHEVRARWGEAAMEASNTRLRGLRAGDYEAAQRKAIVANEALAAAMDAGDAGSPQAMLAAKLHHEWLQCWGQYTPAMHVGLASMYVEDERFAAHYEAVRPGAAAFLRDAITRYHAGSVSQ